MSKRLNDKGSLLPKNLYKNEQPHDRGRKLKKELVDGARVTVGGGGHSHFPQGQVEDGEDLERTLSVELMRSWEQAKKPLMLPAPHFLVHTVGVTPIPKL